MMMRGAVLQTALGLLIGIPASLLCVRFGASQLHDVKGMDYSLLLRSILTPAVARICRRPDSGATRGLD
jgi:macrolide transport system ATP-binding/permease protein